MKKSKWNFELKKLLSVKRLREDYQREISRYYHIYNYYVGGTSEVDIADDIIPDFNTPVN